MSNKTSVVHSDPEILAGLPYSLAHVYRYGTSSTISNEGTVSMSFLMRFRRFPESSRSRPLEAAHEVLTAGARPAR
jgi:hypothetical protein